MTESSAARGRTIVLLDGGVGQEIHRRSAGPASPLWSVQVMMDEPDLVEAVHLEFIEAGARIVTANTYTATPPRLARAGVADMFEAMHGAALAAAESAREKSGQAVRIAGCLPPLVGSYRSDLTPPRRRMPCGTTAESSPCRRTASICSCARPCYRRRKRARRPWRRAKAASRSGPRSRSTMPTVRCCARARGLAQAPKPAVAAGAEAVLINCSSPEAVATAMPRLAGIGVPFGGYANGFVSIGDLQPGGTVDVLEARDDLGPASYADHALGWVASGAAIVGGCCEIGARPYRRARAAARGGRPPNRGRSVARTPLTRDRRTAVHDEALAGGPAAGVRSQVDRDARDVLGLAEPSQRGSGDSVRRALGVLPECAREIRAH